MDNPADDPKEYQNIYQLIGGPRHLQIINVVPPPDADERDVSKLPPSYRVIVGDDPNDVYEIRSVPMFDNTEHQAFYLGYASMTKKETDNLMLSMMEDANSKVHSIVHSPVTKRE